MDRNIFEALSEAIDAVDNSTLRGNHDIVLLPPDNDPYASDEEDGDDDIGLTGNINLPADTSGAIEIHHRFTDETDEASEEFPKGNKRKWIEGTDKFEQEWYEPTERTNIEETFPLLVDLSELDLYKMFFDREVEQLIIDCTNKYASTQKNDPSFSLDAERLWDFFTIITFSLYNVQPQFTMYWSSEADITSTFVRGIMLRNSFKKVKTYLHVCDNEKLNVDDKWAKLRPLFDVVNEKLIQFGVFAEHLSIDEQMVPDFGRQSCKMFIRGKPIRFGYKNWVLCSDDGYPFKVNPYQGKAERNASPLGPRTVKNLLNVVDDDKIHDVYFDNFFTSVPLLEELKKRGIPATGTIRINRLPGLPPSSIKEMEKKERGTMSVCSTKDLCAVRWADNKVVTVLSNRLTEEPSSKCKRYSKIQKCKIDVPQPNLIRMYNAYMGGVDQLDGYLNNLRPCIGRKKWYWMQLINLVRLMQVAVFHFFSHLPREKKFLNWILYDLWFTNISDVVEKPKY